MKAAILSHGLQKHIHDGDGYRMIHYNAHRRYQR